MRKISANAERNATMRARNFTESIETAEYKRESRRKNSEFSNKSRGKEGRKFDHLAPAIYPHLSPFRPFILVCDETMGQQLQDAIAPD